MNSAHSNFHCQSLVQTCKDGIGTDSRQTFQPQGFYLRFRFSFLRPSLLFILLLLQVQGAGASSDHCRSTLKDKGFRDSIQQLAEMRRNLDQRKMSPNGDLTDRALEGQFEKKLDAFIRHTGLSQQQILEEIKTHITRRTEPNLKKEEVDSNLEKTQRDQVVRHFLKPIYNYESSGTLGKMVIFPSPSNVVLNDNRILVKSEDSFWIVDPLSNHRYKLPANHVRVLDQHKTLALFSFNSTKQTYQIGYFDVQTNQIVSTVSLNLPPSIQKQYHSGMIDFAISPFKSKAAIGDSTGRILIFDLKTGDIIDETNNHLTASSWIKDLFFLNENQILFDGDSQIFKYDLTSKLRTSMAQNEEGSGFGLALSEDHQFVYWARYKKIVTVDAQTLEVISQDPIYDLRNTGAPGVHTESLKKIPEDGNHFFARSSLDYGIFNSYLERIFDFNKRYSSINIRDVLFSHDKETVYILHKNTPASETILIDQWKLDTSNIHSAL